MIGVSMSQANLRTGSNTKEKLEFDIKEGFDFNLDNGKVLKVEPHLDRVALRIWRGNGVMMETLVYDEPYEGEYENDRVHLIVHYADVEPEGFLMTVQEAEEMRELLDLAIKEAEDMGIPRE